MRLNKKIASFTLSEMMVVLVISAIVISLAITVLSLVQKQIKSINSNFEKNTEIRLLERTLYQDFNTYNINYNKSTNILECISPMDTIKYTFELLYILRNTDTLKIKTDQITVYLDAEIATEKSIDALSLTLSKEFQNRELFFYKQKDASHYLNK